MIEISFIILLYYSNLLMGEYTHGNNPAGDKLLSAALYDIFTVDNFIIAIVSALIGYVVVEYLRTKV